MTFGEGELLRPSARPQEGPSVYRATKEMSAFEGGWSKRGREGGKLGTEVPSRDCRKLQGSSGTADVPLELLELLVVAELDYELAAAAGVVGDLDLHA
jgi:hypothetical protein